MAIKSILVCAPSKCRSLISCVESLLNRGIGDYALGHPARVEEKKILNQTLDAKKTAFPWQFETWKSFEKKPINPQPCKASTAPTLGPEKRAQRKNDVCRSFSLPLRHPKSTGQYIQLIFSSEPRLFADHARGASMPTLKGMTFDVSVYRWSRSGLGGGLLGFRLSKAKKVVFAGEPFPNFRLRLSPLSSGKEDLPRRYFWKSLNSPKILQAAQLLDLQTRMPEVIMGFSNEWFLPRGKWGQRKNTKTHEFPNESAMNDWYAGSAIQTKWKLGRV